MKSKDEGGRRKDEEKAGAKVALGDRVPEQQATLSPHFPFSLCLSFIPHPSSFPSSFILAFHPFVAMMQKISTEKGIREMSKVEVYGADWCGDTQRTLRQLDRLGVAYDYIDVEQDEQASA